MAACCGPVRACRAEGSSGRGSSGPRSAPTGGIWIIEAETQAAAEAFYKNDPFWRAGLRKSVRVSHWAKAHWSPASTACMEASGIG